MAGTGSFEQPGLSVIGGALCVIDKNGNELEVLLANDRMITFESLFSGNPFYSPGQTLIRTDRFRAIGGFDTSIWGADDLDAWFRLRQTGELKFVNRIALRYRQHPLNASNDVRRIATHSLKVMKRHVRSAAPVQQRLLMARGRLYLYKYVFKKTLINWSAFRGSAGVSIRVSSRVITLTNTTKRMISRKSIHSAAALVRNSLRIEPDQFRLDLSHRDAVGLFKRRVELLEIETTSYCNRTCSFCPNAFIDRLSEKKSCRKPYGKPFSMDYGRSTTTVR
jgi:hypothetical protein